MIKINLVESSGYINGKKYPYVLNLQRVNFSLSSPPPTQKIKNKGFNYVLYMGQYVPQSGMDYLISLNSIKCSFIEKMLFSIFFLNIFLFLDVKIYIMIQLIYIYR